jgi:tetratricopeptide (TPR) repeat protein
MALGARFVGCGVVLFALMMNASCTRKQRSGSAFNRIVRPMIAQKRVDESYQEKAIELNSRYYYLLGEYLARKKDLRGALLALERARVFNENEPEIYFSLSNIYLQLGKVEEAEALLRKTLELDPDHFSAMLDLAQLIKGSGSLDEVHELFARASKVDPDSDEAALGLVVLEMANKEFSKARQSLKEFIRRKPDSHLGYFYLGTLDQDLGKYAEAEKNYKKALALRPDFARATAYLAQIYEVQNREDDALRIFEQAAEHAQGVSFLKRIGEIRSERKETDRARRAFESYLEVDKQNTEVMLRLAFLELEAKDYDAAEKRFKKVAELRPEFASAQYFVGVLLEEKKDYKAALKWLQKVKPGTSVSFDALKAMGRIYVELKDYETGWSLFEAAYDDDPEVTRFDREKLSAEMVSFLTRSKRSSKAIKFADKKLKEYPKSEDLYYARAIAQEEAGEALQAARDMEFLISKHNTKNPAILNFVGYVYADEGLYLTKAEKYIRQAQKLRPEDPYIADSLGWVLYKRGDYRNAEVWLRKAALKAPDETIVLEHLADCLVKLGSLQEATELYAKALEKGHKKEADQTRLQAKHEGLGEKLRALCASNASDSACRVVREPRAPAAKTN